MFLLSIRQQLVRLVQQILQFLMTMSMLKETERMLLLKQCQIDVLMRSSRLSP
jgi:hypothetical protein